MGPYGRVGALEYVNDGGKIVCLEKSEKWQVEIMPVHLHRFEEWIYDKSKVLWENTQNNKTKFNSYDFRYIINIGL